MLGPDQVDRCGNSGATADGLPYCGRQHGAERRGGEDLRGRRLLINDDHDDAAEKSADTYGGKRIPDRASRTLVMLG